MCAPPCSRCRNEASSPDRRSSLISLVFALGPISASPPAHTLAEPRAHRALVADVAPLAEVEGEGLRPGSRGPSLPVPVPVPVYLGEAGHPDAEQADGGIELEVAEQLAGDVADHG